MPMAEGPAPLSISYAGLTLDRPRVMGIINVTPDSFSDGGDAFACSDAIARGREMVAAGADILDIGGESTRPGSKGISTEEEIRRVVPVIEGLVSAGVVISIDTRHAVVMTAAVVAGAHIVNDVTALTADPMSLETVARLGCPVVLMHMQGEPGNMQNNPQYDDPVKDVSRYLGERIKACETAGIGRSQIAIDPGIGFGKTVEHNLQILHHIGDLHDHGCPLVLGISRKSFIGALADVKQPKDRLPGSLAGALYGCMKKVQIFRVHDVAETRQALIIYDHIQSVTTGKESKL